MSLTLKSTGSKPSSGLKGWYTRQKARRAAKGDVVPKMLRVLTFVFTLAGMSLGLSFLPLFPQPLPVVIAFLIAFIAYKNPVFSLPVGGALIGLGLVYNVSKVDFISALGDQVVREAVVFGFLLVFTTLPIIFRKHVAAIAINLGIIAAIILFSGQAYFLSIPVVFASIVIFKKFSVLTAIYYGLISTPLLMMQYLGFVIEAANIQPDWWVLPNSSPTIFTPLTAVLTTMQDSMIQFRLFDTSRVVYAITAQITQAPPLAEHTITEVMSHYLDSIPGIVLFLVIVAVSTLAFVLIMRFVLKTAQVSENILPPITAAIGTLIFFICLSVLQGPLAFEARMTPGTIVIGAVAAAFFALPALFMDQTPKRRATVDMIEQKARELLDRLGTFETILQKVQETLPMDVSSIKSKMLILKDRLNDTLSKTLNEALEPSEIDVAFNDLEATSREIQNLNAELEFSLKTYQILLEGEYSTWLGRFQDIGLQIGSAEKKDFQQDLLVEERIARIKEILDSGENLVTEVLELTEKAYIVVRSLYDPDLPEESQAIVFAKKQISENCNPWVASNSLFTALNNWRKQYHSQISLSVDCLLGSISVVAGLRNQSGSLRQVLDNEFSKIMDLSERAENLGLLIPENAMTVGGIVTVGDVFLSSLEILGDALVILNEKLTATEASIVGLLPAEDYVWGKNASLRDRMASVIDVFLHHSEHTPDQVFEALPKAAAYVGECLSTIAEYKDLEEVLLNYPVAEIAIEDSLEQKSLISIRDLPFEPKIAEEYFRLFNSKRFSDYSFDRQKITLSHAKR